MTITYIITPAILKELTGISGNVDEKLIYPEIKAAQDLHIMPICGTALFNKIITDIAATSLAGVYLTLVDDYLIPALANYVMSELPDGVNYQFTNKGVIGKTSDNSERPSMSDLYAVVSKYKNRAEHYRQRAIKYLQQNRISFTEYLNPGSGVDTVHPEDEGFTCPIYLGEDDYTNKTFAERFQGNGNC
jgi:hypothetical protein